MSSIEVREPGTGREARGERAYGVLLMLGSAASFSTIGVFTRAVSLPLPEVLFVRGVFGALSIWVVARVFTGQRLFDRRGLTWPALTVAALFTVGMTSIVVAYRVGTVVNVSVVYATIPIIVGLFHWAFLRRRPSRLFWFCGLAVVAGVAIMTGGGLGAGDALGMGLALLMTCCVAGVILIARAHRDTPMLAASGLACLLSGVVVVPFAGRFEGGARDLLVCALFGVVTLGLGRVCLVLGSGRVPSRDAALMDVLDAPMTPLWTWALLGEVPSAAGALGGCVVVAAVLAGVRFDREAGGSGQREPVER
ncbi:DMT family transporter [Actinomadura roseirufa]|uniref:DMT family transporter n=1 Tax=Actinomadura roseirufa TaxID=2094049 RepID=UPI0010412A35|nr:DMT family transporter [Actinomadura roseirufa]